MTDESVSEFARGIRLQFTTSVERRASDDVCQVARHHLSISGSYWESDQMTELGAWQKMSAKAFLTGESAQVLAVQQLLESFVQAPPASDAPVLASLF